RRHRDVAGVAPAHRPRHPGHDEGRRSRCRPRPSARHDLRLLAADHLPGGLHRHVHLPHPVEPRVLVAAVPEDLLPAAHPTGLAEGTHAMTTPAALYGQGISFPPRVGPDGGMVWSAGEQNVRECICTILRTQPGERVERPGFGCGLDRYLFEPNTVA